MRLVLHLSFIHNISAEEHFTVNKVCCGGSCFCKMLCSYHKPKNDIWVSGQSWVVAGFGPKRILAWATLLPVHMVKDLQGSKLAALLRQPWGNGRFPLQSVMTYQRHKRHAVSTRRKVTWSEVRVVTESQNGVDWRRPWKTIQFQTLPWEGTPYEEVSAMWYLH